MYLESGTCQYMSSFIVTGGGGGERLFKQNLIVVLMYSNSVAPLHAPTFSSTSNAYDAIAGDKGWGASVLTRGKGGPG